MFSMRAAGFIPLLLTLSYLSVSTIGQSTTESHTSIQQKVQTTNGPIQGHVAENRSHVIEFLGIPFAQPPVGDLRFAPPQAYVGHGSYVASTWGFDCPQGSAEPADFPGLTPQAQRIIDYFAGNAGTPRNEDCLTLNIWTKASNQELNSKARPVLVFFHGGRTTIGVTHSPFYDGQYFADAEDVVVVSVGYRLNIFGFPGAPGHVQNLGFRDQRLGVEWIRDNIVGFGGDPSKITIFGQSSGGQAVDYWSYAYVDDPIASGMISHSGNALSFNLNPPNVTLANWYNVSAQVGCGSTGDTVPCMRTKNWTAIEEAAYAIPEYVEANPLRSTPSFYPSADEEIVFSNYTKLSLQGAYAKLPYLLGNTNTEQGYYIIPATAAGANATKADGDRFCLQSFTCPDKFEADSRRAHGVPVWQFRYFGHWDNLRLFPGSGAYHGTDVEMIFGNDAVVSGLPPSEAEELTTALMQRAWAAFAADPAKGLLQLGWPEYDPEKESLIRLAYNNQPRADFVKPSLYDAPCSTLELGAYQTGKA